MLNKNYKMKLYNLTPENNEIPIINPHVDEQYIFSTKYIISNVSNISHNNTDFNLISPCLWEILDLVLKPHLLTFSYKTKRLKTAHIYNDKSLHTMQQYIKGNCYNINWDWISTNIKLHKKYNDQIIKYQGDNGFSAGRIRSIKNQINILIKSAYMIFHIDDGIFLTQYLLSCLIALKKGGSSIIKLNTYFNNPRDVSVLYMFTMNFKETYLYLSDHGNMFLLGINLLKTISKCDITKLYNYIDTIKNDNMSVCAINPKVKYKSVTTDNKILFYSLIEEINKDIENVILPDYTNWSKKYNYVKLSNKFRI